MSSQTPFMGAWATRMECPTTAEPPRLLELASSPSFEPRRSSLVAWTIRMARVADLVVERAFPARRTSSRTTCLVEKTLDGLDRVCGLIPSHVEVVAAERARLKISRMIGQRSDRYRCYQAVRCAMLSACAELDETSSCNIYLNPACCWTRLEADTSPIEGAHLGCSALFFLVENDLRGIRMNLEGQVLINELADYQPCTIGQWSRLSSLLDITQLVSLVRHLGQLGLVAYA